MHSPDVDSQDTTDCPVFEASQGSPNQDNVIEAIDSTCIRPNEKEKLLHSLLRQRPNKPSSADTDLTLGQRVADRMAQVAGSWPFIIVFVFVLCAWIALNIVMAKMAFDPYPFILLNLALSCLAAIQAPIIMMSQNRQSEKDRVTAESDYQVNLKSEIVLEDLHMKMDAIIARQEEIAKMLEMTTLEKDKD